MVLFPEVNGVPVTWEDPLSVPSGGNGVVTRIDPFSWPVKRADGSTLWRHEILTPGAEDDTWTLTIAGTGYDYVVLLGDDSADVANGLQAAAAVGALADGYTVTDSGEFLSVVWEGSDEAAEEPEVATDGAGLTDRFIGQAAGTPTGFDPQPTPG